MRQTALDVLEACRTMRRRHERLTAKIARAKRVLED